MFLVFDCTTAAAAKLTFEYLSLSSDLLLARVSVYGFDAVEGG